MEEDLNCFLMEDNLISLIFVYSNGRRPKSFTNDLKVFVNTGCPKIKGDWFLAYNSGHEEASDLFLMKIHIHTYILSTKTYLSD